MNFSGGKLEMATANVCERVSVTKSIASVGESGTREGVFFSFFPPAAFPKASIFFACDTALAALTNFCLGEVCWARYRFTI